jgi:hypothetical protein
MNRNLNISGRLKPQRTVSNIENPPRGKNTSFKEQK